MVPVRRLLVVSAVVLLAAGLASSQPAPKKPDPEKLVTRTYDLKPILGRRVAAVGLSDTDAVIRLILETARVGELKPGADGPQLVQRDGGKLEVRATEKVHEQVKDLLDALAGLAGVAVDLRADLVELDRDTFEKVKPLLRPAKGKTEPPPAVALPVEVTDTILKRGKVVQTSTGRYPNGAESVVSARQSVFTYPNQPVGGKGAASLFGKEGFRLSALAVVSGDRRSVRLRLTEQSAEVVGLRKREFGEVDGKPVVATSPEVSEFGRSGTVEVDDGGAVLFKLDYAPKDKVWVVILRPAVFIRAEEDVREQGK